MQNLTSYSCSLTPISYRGGGRWNFARIISFSRSDAGHTDRQTTDKSTTRPQIRAYLDYSPKCELTRHSPLAFCVMCFAYFNPYPGKWGVKWPPDHFCLCISETVRHAAMRFSAIVQGSKGYLLPYKVLPHLYWKCGYDGVKPGVHFRNLAKVVCSTVNLTITSNKHFHQLLSYFHGHLPWICCWHGFLMSIFIGVCETATPKTCVLSLKIYRIYFLSEVITCEGNKAQWIIRPTM